MADMVNQPPHYTQGDVEAIDGIRAALGPKGFRDYCRGNAMKYLWRYGKKGEHQQDLEKALWYLQMCLGYDPRYEGIPMGEA